MRSFSVVADEPRDQLAIELIGSDQQLLMVINELLLNGPVKTFEGGVHLGSSGIGMPASSRGSMAPQQERRSFRPAEPFPSLFRLCLAYLAAM